MNVFNGLLPCHYGWRYPCLSALTLRRETKAKQCTRTWCVANLCPWMSCHTYMYTLTFYHDDVIKWKHFPRYWPFVRGIHRSPVNSPHKGQWRRALMFSLIYARINGWVNKREAGDLRRYHAHYDVIVMRVANPLYFVIKNNTVAITCVTRFPQLSLSHREVPINVLGFCYQQKPLENSV